jgi:homocitrate synthase NifV
MALKYIEGLDIGISTERFSEIINYTMNAAGRTVPAWKPVVGTNVFAHESGIHVDGIIKNPHTYEIFSPEEVGLVRQIVVGKHSGSRTVEMKFAEYGIEISRDEANAILPTIRHATVELHRPLFDKELVEIYNDYKASSASSPLGE